MIQTVVHTEDVRRVALINEETDRKYRIRMVFIYQSQRMCDGLVYR